jgi:hypothetical protein
VADAEGDRPVRNISVIPGSSATLSIVVNHGPRSGLRQNLA